jgi:hypothetical protein
MRQTDMFSSGRSVVSTTTASSQRSSSSHLSTSSQAARSRLRMLGVGTPNDDFFIDTRGIIQAKNGKQHHVIAVTRSSSYNKMLQRQQERQDRLRIQQEKRSAMAASDDSVSGGSSKILSVWSSLSNGGRSVGSNMSVGSMSTGGFSFNTGLRAIRPPRIKKATVKSSKVMEKLQRTDSVLARERRKKKRLQNKRKKAAKLKARADRQQKELGGMSLASSTIGSQVGSEIALDPHGVPEAVTKKERIKERLRRRTMARAGGDQSQTEKVSPPRSRQVEIPILTMVDASSHLPLPPATPPSHVTKEETMASSMIKKPPMIPGRPPLPPKAKSESKIKMSRNAKAFMAKSPFLSRRKRHTEDANAATGDLIPNVPTLPSVDVLVSSKKEEPQQKEQKEDGPANNSNKTSSAYSPVVFTTLSRASSLGSLNLPCIPKSESKIQDDVKEQRTRGSTTPASPETNLMDELFSKIWNAVDQSQQQKIQSALSRLSFDGYDDEQYFLSDEEGGLSEISSSEDESSDSDDDFDNLDDFDDDEDLDSEDDSISSDNMGGDVLLVVVDDQGKPVQAWSKDAEVYLGERNDMMLEMTQRYLTEMKDIKKSMKGWFHSVFSMAPVLEEDSDSVDEERETASSNQDQRGSFQGDERDRQEEPAVRSGSSLAEF